VLCAGDSIFVPYTVLDDFQPNNVFTAQLSDASGSFANPVALGLLSGTASSTIAGRIPIGTPASSQYKVRVIASSNPATGRANTLNIIIKPLPPAPAIAANTPVCAGTALRLTAGPLTNSVMFWAGPNGFTSNQTNPVVSNATPLIAGIYSVRATVDGCTGAWANINISVVTVPANISAGDNSPLCAGGQLLLTAQSVTGVNYRWDGPGGFQSALQNPVRPNIQTAQQGLYSVYVFTGPCSSLVTTLNVVIQPTPSGITAGAQQTTVCEFDTVRLTASASPGASWHWQGPSGFASTMQNPQIPSVTTMQTGVYSLIASIGTCSSTVSTVSITVNAAPSTVNTGSNSPVCQGDTLVLQAGNATGVTYLWQGPQAFTSSLQNPEISPALPIHSGTYTLTLDNGCASAQVSLTVQVIAIPNAAQASNDSPICAGDALSLKATTVANATYYWIGPNGFTSGLQNPVIPVANVSHAGDYSVYTIVGACSSIVSVTQAVIIAALNPPSLSFTGAACEGQTLQLNAAGVTGAQYFWSGPGTWVSTQQNPAISPATVSLSGQYSCYMTLGGCTSGLSVLSLTIHPIPMQPSLSLVADTLWSSAPIGNQWYELSSGIIAGAVSNWYVPLSNGDYYSIVTINSCSSLPSDTMNYVLLQAEASMNVLPIQLYPNPTHSYFMLAGGDAPMSLKVQMLDLQGRIILNAEYQHQGTTSVTIPDDLPKGIYQLIVLFEDKQQTFKLIIE
jgi:hypothetical protein